MARITPLSGAGMPSDPPRRLLDSLRGEEEEEERLSHFRPQIGRDYPLNLSISLSGGKETNEDSLSNGE